MFSNREVSQVHRGHENISFGKYPQKPLQSPTLPAIFVFTWCSDFHCAASGRDPFIEGSVKHKYQTCYLDLSIWGAELSALPGHLSATLAPTAVFVGSVMWLQAPVPFSKWVLLSSEDLEWGPLFKGVRTVSAMHRGLGVYYCWLMQMFFIKELGCFFKGKQNHSCCILGSLRVASQFHEMGLLSCSVAEPQPLLLTLGDNEALFHYCPCHTSREVEMQG